jgi:hypothetical protein
MSNFKVQGNSSGTGTTTLQTGNTNSDYTYTLPTADGTNGQFLSTNGSGVLSFASAGGTTTNALTMNNGGSGDASGTTFNGSAARTLSYNTLGAAGTSATNAFTGANTFYNGTGQTFGTGTSTQDGFVISGRAGGSSSYRITFTPGTLSASRTVTFPDGGGNYTVGYLNLPAVGTKTSSYTLATADVGKYVQVGTSGSITIPDATFAEGDVISIFNNTSAGITITCSITTAYISGTDSDKATVTLATRGVATILFISSTVCVISGSVS